MYGSEKVNIKILDERENRKCRIPSNSSVYQMTICRICDHFVSEATSLEKPPAWSLRTSYSDLNHANKLFQIQYFCSV